MGLDELGLMFRMDVMHIYSACPVYLFALTIYRIEVIDKQISSY